MLTQGIPLTLSLRIIISLLALLFVFIVSCAQLYDNSVHQKDHPTTTSSKIITQNENVSTPVIVSTAVEVMIPYSKTSIWNTPIGPSAKYDPYSDELIATLELSNEGQFTSDPDRYSFTVYFADENTPRWDISCLKYNCTVVTPDNTYRTEVLKDVPIPFDAKPSAGTDAQMIIIDKTTYAEYDLWQVERTETGWRVSNSSVYNILWNGTPTQYGSRGAGLPYYAGLIRPWEIAQGKIEHALAFGADYPTEAKCVFPASKTDGDSTLPFAIPEGARLQLDPSLTEEDFDQIGLDRTGKVIARALQEYGMILVDHSGSFKLIVEDLTNNPYATQGWTDLGLKLTKETVSSIPYTSFRVLELPPGYWDPLAESQYHGRCLTFPSIP